MQILVALIFFLEKKSALLKFPRQHGDRVFSSTVGGQYVRKKLSIALHI